MPWIRFSDDSRFTSPPQRADKASFASLKEATSDDSAALVMEGEYGGTIYLTCPVADIRCTECELEEILEILDELDFDDPNGRQLVYERHDLPAGTGPSIGEHLWIGPQFEDWVDASGRPLPETIASILRGGPLAGAVKPLTHRPPTRAARSQLTRSVQDSRPGVLSRDGMKIDLG